MYKIWSYLKIEDLVNESWKSHAKTVCVVEGLHSGFSCLVGCPRTGLKGKILGLL